MHQVRLFLIWRFHLKNSSSRAFQKVAKNARMPRNNIKKPRLFPVIVHLTGHISSPVIYWHLMRTYVSEHYLLKTERLSGPCAFYRVIIIWALLQFPMKNESSSVQEFQVELLWIRDKHAWQLCRAGFIEREGMKEKVSLLKTSAAGSLFADPL